MRQCVAEHLSAYSDHVLQLWSQLLGHCTRHLPRVSRHLQRKACMLARAFWKGQCFVHTCRSGTCLPTRSPGCVSFLSVSVSVSQCVVQL